MADRYLLKVTAGPSYEDQKQISVNTSEVNHITSDAITTDRESRDGAPP